MEPLSSYEVIKTLIEASPSSVPLEDRDDMSALEHAIFSDAPIKVVNLLQYVTRKMNENVQQQSKIENAATSLRMTTLARRVSQDSQDHAQQHVPMDVEIDQKPSSAESIVPARRDELSSRRRGGVISAEGNL